MPPKPSAALLTGCKSEISLCANYRREEPRNLMKKFLPCIFMTSTICSEGYKPLFPFHGLGFGQRHTVPLLQAPSPPATCATGFFVSSGARAALRGSSALCLLKPQPPPAQANGGVCCASPLAYIEAERKAVFLSSSRENLFLQNALRAVHFCTALSETCKGLSVPLDEFKSREQARSTQVAPRVTGHGRAALAIIYLHNRETLRVSSHD